MLGFYDETRALFGSVLSHFGFEAYFNVLTGEALTAVDEEGSNRLYKRNE